MIGPTQTNGKSTTYVCKEMLLAWRDALSYMIDNYVEYEYGDWENRWKNEKKEEKDYKYSNEWEEILKGNDYY